MESGENSFSTDSQILVVVVILLRHLQAIPQSEERSIASKASQRQHRILQGKERQIPLWTKELCPGVAEQMSKQLRLIVDFHQLSGSHREWRGLMVYGGVEMHWRRSLAIALAEFWAAELANHPTFWKMLSASLRLSVNDFATTVFNSRKRLERVKLLTVKEPTVCHQNRIIC